MAIEKEKMLETRAPPTLPTASEGFTAAPGPRSAKSRSIAHPGP